MAAGAGWYPPGAPQAAPSARRRWGEHPGAAYRPGDPDGVPDRAAEAPRAGAAAAGRGFAGRGGPLDAPGAAPAGRGTAAAGPWPGEPPAAARGYAPSPDGEAEDAEGFDAGILSGHDGPAAGDDPRAPAAHDPADDEAAWHDIDASARAEEAAARRHEALARAYAAKQDHARTELPDYDRVVGAARLPVSAALAEALVESEHTARLEYHLARSPEKLAWLNRLSPLDAARAVGRLEAAIADAARPRPTRAPAPLAPLRGGAAGPMRSLAELARSENAADYIELRRAQRRA